ncbi:MAG: hypothetical protein DRJ56_08630 [Thermoprotei archaeon]|nr:MAG: hypothetical protein DRJ56_08630 [Thermoprotei archaeon]
MAAALTVARGRVFWIARTLREVEHVSAHCRFLGIEVAVVKGRAELCPALSEPMTSEEASAYCSAVRLRCQYYTNMLSGVEPSCPYYMQFNQTKNAKVIAATYNMLLKAGRLVPLPPVRSEDILVVDEAHNIIATVEEHSFTKASLERALQELSIIKGPPALRDFLHRLLANMASFKPSTRAAILAESLIYHGKQLRRLLAEKGLRPRSSLHSVGKALRAACRSPFRIEDDRFTVVEVKELELPRAPTVFLSGTIGRHEAELLGAEYLDFTVFASYEAETYVTEDLTSAYEQRTPEMFKRYAELLRRIKSPAIAFAASYKVLQGIVEADKELEQQAFIERPDMKSAEAEELAEAWKALARRGEPALYIGVCGGRGSEGVDFNEAQAILILGAPFPEPDDPALQALYQYYADKFASDAEVREPERLAELHAVVLPAARKVAQAVGRAFREPGKRALVILADQRFKRLKRLLPKWIVRELRVVNSDQVPPRLGTQREGMMSLGVIE